MKRTVSKILMLSLVGTMVLGLAACGTKDEGVSDTPETPIVETPDVSTPDVEETPDEEETPEVTDDAETIAAYTALNQKGIDAIAAMFADSSAEVTSQDIIAKMKEVYGENYLPSMSMDETVFTELTGLTSDDYVEFIAETPMMSTHVDSIFVVKAAEGKLETVKMALDSYRTSQIENAMQYPMNLPKLEASQVVSFDDYVVFIMLGGYIEEPIADGDVVGDPTVDDTMPTDGDVSVNSGDVATTDGVESDDTSVDPEETTDITESDVSTDVEVEVDDTNNATDFS